MKKKQNKKILIRADGTKKLGFGHLVRSCVLAAALAELGNEILFLTADPDERVEKFFSQKNFNFEPIALSKTGDPVKRHLEVMDEFGARTIIIDSYLPDDAYRLNLKKEGKTVIALDDVYAHYSHADMVINHNPSADPSRYTDFNGKLLAGPKYALIDPRFSGIEKRDSSKDQVDILVTMGGTDAKGQTKRLIRILDRVNEDFNITAVGGFYESSTRLDGLKHKCAFIPFTNDMPALIGKCDIAVTAGGVTCMELACAGAPFLILLTDDYQLENARSYQHSGAAFYAGSIVELTDGQILAALKNFFSAKKQWAKMSLHGKRLIDGKGAARAAREIEKLAG